MNILNLPNISMQYDIRIGYIQNSITQVTFRILKYMLLPQKEMR